MQTPAIFLLLIAWIYGIFISLYTTSSGKAV